MNDFLELYVDAPDIQDATPVYVRASVIVQALIEQLCTHFKLPARDRALYLVTDASEQELVASHTLMQNQVTNKARLELRLVVITSLTWDWIERGNKKSFEVTSHISFEDENTGMEFQVLWQPAVIGRHDNEYPYRNALLAVDLTKLDPAYVSRQHACLTRKSGVYYIESLTKKKKTYLNQSALIPEKRYPIQPGDRIKVGKVTLIFKLIQ